MVFNLPKEEINFAGAVGATESGSHTVITFKPRESKIIEFYLTKETDLEMFVSPILDLA